MHKKRSSILILAAALLLFSAWMIASRNSSGKICLKLTGNEKNECVMRLVDKYLDRHQVSAALAFLNDYQTLDKNFYATDCHGVVHYIGDKAYMLYKKGYRLDFGKYSSICVYGFYHAFTSSFILSDEFKDASDFCVGLEKRSPGDATACYHGIGHGAIYDFYEDHGIRDPITIINKGIDLCERILSKENDVNECTSGVYDGIGDKVLDASYTDLTPSKIYAYCQDQPEKYKALCYENISHLVYRKTLISFSDLVDYVLKTPDINYKEAAIAGLATIYIVDLKGESVDNGILVCKRLPEDIKKSCLGNMSFKLVGDTIDGKYYEVAKNFCDNSVLTAEEKKSCFSASINGLFNFYSRPQLIAKCKADEVDFFKEICLNQLNEP